MTKTAIHYLDPRGDLPGMRCGARYETAGSTALADVTCPECQRLGGKS